jgi:restriction system protein
MQSGLNLDIGQILRPFYTIIFLVIIGAAILKAAVKLVPLYFRGKKTKGWLDDRQLLAMLKGLKPSEFEEFIADMFRHMGYDAVLTGRSGDGGIDIEMRKGGLEYFVQCKKFITRNVTPHDVRDFYGAISGRGVSGRGFFITTNIFTLQAERFAEDKPIELVDGNGLVRLIRENGLMDQPKKEEVQTAIVKEETCPKCGSKLVKRINQKDGKSFWGCSSFPKCRFTKTIPST